MKTKTTKIIIPIITALTAVVAIFFAAPLKDWREYREYIRKNTNTGVAGGWMYTEEIGFKGYSKYCLIWWKKKFTQTTIDGGELPEVTVKP